MAEHGAVARRFAELLDTLELDRRGFVVAVDGAVTERTLYSILNGHRRPSRSLAVLIERIWGFRADYLLSGREPAWLPGDQTAGRAMENEDVAAVLAALAAAPEVARTVRRDLDDSVLWTELWQRTNAMLRELTEKDGPVAPVERARVAFGECMAVADTFGAMSAVRYQRRVLHLVNAFIGRSLDRMLTEAHSGLDRAAFVALKAEAERGREALGAQERDMREALETRAQAPSPLAELESVPAEQVAGRLLAERIAEVVRQRSRI